MQQNWWNCLCLALNRKLNKAQMCVKTQKETRLWDL